MDDLQDKLAELLNQLDESSFSAIQDTEPNREYPVLPLRDQVIMPHVVTRIFVGRDRSVKAIETAFAQGRPIITVAQRDPNIEHPEFEDLFAVGTEVEIARVLRKDGLFAFATLGPDSLLEIRRAWRAAGTGPSPRGPVP